MLRRTLILVAVIAINVCCFSGCKKNSSEAETEKVRTMVEYETEAKEQINEENMQVELDKLEKAIQEEAGQSP